MIDINKKYTTKDGRKVTFYEVVGDYIYGRVDGHKYAFTWQVRDGIVCGGFSPNYTLIPAKREFWVNVYPNNDTFSYNSRISADKSAGASRIACVKVTEGEGLDDES